MSAENCSPRTLSGLSREYLRGLLAAELRKEPARINGDYVRQLRQELERRGPDPVYEDDRAVRAACDKFRAQSSSGRGHCKCLGQGWLTVAASFLLLLGFLFFALPKAAQADGIREVIGWWNDSVFQFIPPGETPREEEYVFQTDHPGLQQIYDAVAELGVTVPVVPTQIPMEYELLELKSVQMNGNIALNACLANETDKYLISLTIYDNSKKVRLEKNTEAASIWDFAGIEHFIICNTDSYTISWVTDRIECAIVSNCKEEDVYNLIKSIYTSEG